MTFIFFKRKFFFNASEWNTLNRKIDWMSRTVPRHSFSREWNAWRCIKDGYNLPRSILKRFSFLFFPFFFLGISMHFSHSAQQLWHVTTFRSDFVRETLTLMNRLIKIGLECVLCFQTRSLFRKFLLNALEKNISFSKIVQRKMKLMSQVSPFNMHSPFSYLWNIIWFITLWKKK